MRANNRKRNSKLSIVIALLIAIACVAYSNIGSMVPGFDSSLVLPPQQENTTLAEGKTTSLSPAVVNRISDGDTIIVTVPENEPPQRVRLIGIDCPESVHPDKSKNTPQGDAASAYTKSLLAPGQTVWLEKDKSETDKYGRLLRYVWIATPLGEKPTPEEVRTKMLNARLVLDGHAKAKRYEPDTRYATIFENIEKEAY